MGVTIKYISINLFLFRYEKHNFMVARGFFLFLDGETQIWKWTHDKDGDNATKDTYFFLSLTSQR